jgi:hypothetical protein
MMNEQTMQNAKWQTARGYARPTGSDGGAAARARDTALPVSATSGQSRQIKPSQAQPSLAKPSQGFSRKKKIVYFFMDTPNQPKSTQRPWREGGISASKNPCVCCQSVLEYRRQS